VENLAKESRLRWCEHALSRGEDDVQTEELNFKMKLRENWEDQWRHGGGM